MRFIVLLCVSSLHDRVIKLYRHLQASKKIALPSFQKSQLSYEDQKIIFLSFFAKWGVACCQKLALLIEWNVPIRMFHVKCAKYFHTCKLVGYIFQRGNMVVLT